MARREGSLGLPQLFQNPHKRLHDVHRGAAIGHAQDQLFVVEHGLLHGAVADPETDGGDWKEFHLLAELVDLLEQVRTEMVPDELFGLILKPFEVLGPADELVAFGQTYGERTRVLLSDGAARFRKRDIDLAKRVDYFCLAVAAVIVEKDDDALRLGEAGQGLFVDLLILYARAVGGL